MRERSPCADQQRRYEEKDRIQLRHAGLRADLERVEELPATHSHAPRVTTRPALLEHIGRKRRHPPRNMHANSARQSPREARSRDTGAPQRETWRSYGCAAMPLRYPTSIFLVCPQAIDSRSVTSVLAVY